MAVNHIRLETHLRQNRKSRFAEISKLLQIPHTVFIRFIPVKIIFIIYKIELNSAPL